MNKSTKLVATGVALAAAAALATPMAANAAPANGNPSNGNGGGPSCAALWAHIANYYGAPLGQVKAEIAAWYGTDWAQIAQAKFYECGYN